MPAFANGKAGAMPSDRINGIVEKKITLLRFAFIGSEFFSEVNKAYEFCGD